MKSKFSILGLFLASLLISAPLFAAVQVTATVSDNHVVKGDLFILTITINDNDDTYQLDTRPLDDAFVVYRPSQSQSNEYINGTHKQRTQWKVRLQAKAVGDFTIPALKIGDLTTAPIAIKVSEASQANDPSPVDDNKLFIENSIDKSSVYVGQSIIFTTKVYLAINGNDLQLATPKFEGAEVSTYGEDDNSQTVRNGIRYSTITRQFKLTPTQAGEFDIASPLLTGTIRKVVAVNSWQNRAIAEPVNVRGPQLNIKVKAIPEQYQGDWIVSDDLRLIEETDLTLQSYTVGEPITRSITLQIASIDKDKLPNIKLNYPASLRIYPDQDQLQEGKANGLTYGVRIIKHAIIADEDGTLTLPEIKVNWFNSQTDQPEVAVLPAQTLTILPAKPQTLNIPTHSQTNETQQPQTVIVDHQALIYWQITVAMLLLIMLLMVLYHLSYRRLQVHKVPNKKNVLPLNEDYKLLQKYLKNHDAPKCYSMLLKYAQQQFSEIKSLSEFAQKSALTDEKKAILNHEIQWLQICCSDKSQLWNANKLAALLADHEANKSLKNTTNTMNLNP